MKIKCEKCSHQWDYKGKSLFYVTCPRCYRKINIKKVKGGQNEKNKIRKDKDRKH